MTVQLHTYEDKVITFNKERLTDFVVNTWGFSSLNDFLSDYTFDDTEELARNKYLLVTDMNVLTCKNGESTIRLDIYEDGEAYIGVHCNETDRGFTVNTDEETMVKIAEYILLKTKRTMK
ncbi:hypothetical protein Spock_263 [Bacillus phage Spock]|uniref:Uncharacterized protein n=2 Tax=Bequatrovirus spock TaxID=1918008 RepID=A0A1X9SGJ4_9CAUD|nr:hypothetical protein Spock_263 [Bacillus phage Spock]AGY48663.1 hypothetical protein Spock_263 [Bacillus phage Spock]ARQ95178.1 hypothetical protein FLAPJACK_267 [Bacillus phage Flapjack]